MSDQGSHGGASYSETRVPLAFLSTQHRSSTGQSVTIVVKLMVNLGVACRFLHPKFVCVIQIFSKGFQKTQLIVNSFKPL